MESCIILRGNYLTFDHAIFFIVSDYKKYFPHSISIRFFLNKINQIKSFVSLSPTFHEFLLRMDVDDILKIKF